LTFVDRPVGLGNALVYLVTAKHGANTCGISGGASIFMRRGGTAQILPPAVDPQNPALGWSTQIDEFKPKPSALGTVANESTYTVVTDVGDRSTKLALDSVTYTAPGGASQTVSIAGVAKTEAFRGMRTGGSFTVKATPPWPCTPLGTGPRRGSVSQSPCSRPDIALLVDFEAT
jgi:hypothetical protein